MIMWKDTATLENSLVNSLKKQQQQQQQQLKTKHAITILPSSDSPGHLSQRNERTFTQKFLQECL